MISFLCRTGLLQWLFCALEVLLETISLKGTKMMKRGDMDINSQEGCEDGGEARLRHSL